MTLYTRFAAHLDAALDALLASGDLPAGLGGRGGDYAALAPLV